ncbi:MAG: cell division protein FtsZ [Candidatus Methanomethylophilaceae archaeon]|nr:cell division protein FtsZ [Candidatus Methanomethylophilaceae archaeon]
MVYNAKNELKVAIVGVGGAGCNVVSAFTGRYGMDTIAINTDREALHEAHADAKIYTCKGVLHGQGTSGEAELGKKCADIHIEEIKEAVSGYDRVFVIAGLGGGTGTGATPVIIDAIQSLNIMTDAIAIKPFGFEGSRVEVASKGYDKIRAVCPYSIAIKNDSLIGLMSDKTLDEAYAVVNNEIMNYIEARLMDITRDNDGVSQTIDNDDGFDSFIRNSPIFAFINA